MSLYLEKNDVIVFQGDSITDCNRDRFRSSDLGFGYCAMVAAYLSKSYPHLNLSFYNQGIYGNRSAHLKQRWKRTTLRLKPSVLSLLAGINDTLRRYDRGLVTPRQRFYDNYAYLLESTLSQNPDTRLVLSSPFLMPINEEQERYFEDLLEKIEVVQALSAAYGAIYIPLGEVFSKHILTHGSIYTEDGVHPNLEGHKIIAKAWLSATDLITKPPKVD